MLYHTDLTYFPVLTGETPVLLAVLRFSYVLSKLNHREHGENYEIFYFATDSHRLFKINFFNIYLSATTAVRQVCVSQWLN